MKTWLDSSLFDITSEPTVERFAVRDVAAYATASLTINDRAKIKTSTGAWAAVADDNPTNCIAYSSVRVGVEAELGNAFINGDLILADRGDIHGTAYVEGLIHRGNGTHISTTLPRSRTAMPLLAVNAVFPSQISVAPIVERDKSYVVPAGVTVDGLSIHAGGIATMACNSRYYLNRLEVDQGGTLRVDTSCGPVRVFIEEHGWIRGSITDTSQTVRGDVLFAFFGTGGSISVIGSPEGSVVAPNASIVVESGARVNGAFLAKAVTIHQDALVTFFPFLPQWN